MALERRSSGWVEGGVKPIAEARCFLCSELVSRANYRVNSSVARRSGAAFFFFFFSISEERPESYRGSLLLVRAASFNYVVLNELSPLCRTYG